MPGKIVVNKYRPEWGQGYTDDNARLVDLKVPVNFPTPKAKDKYTRALVLPIKLEIVGFWD